MTAPFIDTNVTIRLLTGDDPGKQEASARLFARVEAGNLSITAPDTVIADAVFVLSSPRLYHLPREQVAALLTALVRIPGFQVRSRRIVISALEIYGTRNVDFGDAMIAAAMRYASSHQVYSYDEDFDQFPDMQRIEPD